MTDWPAVRTFHATGMPSAQENTLYSAVTVGLPAAAVWSRLRALADHPLVGEARCAGLLGALELDLDAVADGDAAAEPGERAGR